MTVKIAAKWKKDTRQMNGLEDIIEELIDDDPAYALRRRYSIVVHEVKRITTEVADGGVKVPTVDVLQFEPTGVGSADEAVLREMATRLFKERTNRDDEPQDTLPFEDGPSSDRPRDEFLDDAVEAKKRKR